MNTVFCQKLKKELPGLDYKPYPGDLGARILANISEEAWLAWLAHQTMLINENRLNVLDPKSRKFLESEMDKFLFSDDSQKPEGYVPPP